MNLQMPEVKTIMTPEQFAADYIFRWEDGKSKDVARTHSMDRVDSGNWTGGKIGVGVLVGSNHGVTPQALAKHRNIPVKDVTFPMMRDLKIEEAADLALKGYYEDNGLNKLPWAPVVASVMDFGYTAGALRAVEKLQALVGVAADQKIGSNTVKAYNKWLEDRGVERAARDWASVRTGYYEAVIKANPIKAKYRNGWKARTDYFLPGHAEGWWKRFNNGS
jgi:lysozyme family protein